MPFLGRQPTQGINKTVILDALNATATATYALEKNSVAYTPISAQSLIVSLNGVTQAPYAAYTVNTTNLIFASDLTTDDVIDYVIGLEGPISTAVTVDDDAVTTSTIVDDAVTSDKLANNIDIAGTLDATGLITADAGVSVTGNIDILAEGDLRLQDASGGQYAALQAPTTISSSYTLTLPTDDGDADQVLSTNGSGVLDWVTSGGLYSTWEVVTDDDHEVTASGEQVIMNSAAARDLTLPSSASAGDTVIVKNVGAGTVTIARNGLKIEGADQDGTLASTKAMQIVYVTTALGWKEI